MQSFLQPLLSTVDPKLKLDSNSKLNLPNVGLTTDLPHIIIGTLTYIAGILGVFFLIIAAIQYATSNGSSDRINGAKKTIRFAVAGLIIAILAQTIVVFVLQQGPNSAP